MKALVWLCVAGSLAVLGCSSSDKTVKTDNSSKAIAQALTTGADFDKGNVKTGGLPETTADNVMVQPDTKTLSLKPDVPELMSLEVDNPDESTNPVKATLIQFEDTDKHVEVPRMDIDAGPGSSQTGKVSLGIGFKLSTDICQDFCNKSFKVNMLMAVMLEDGKISQHATRSFTLDCSKDGDKGKCGGDTTAASTGGKPATVKDAGPKDAGIDNSLGETVATAFAKYNMAVCGCNGGSSNVYCGIPDTYTMAQVACVKKAVNDNLDSSGKNAKASCDLATINNYVTMCKGSCTTCSFQGLGDALRKETAAACKMTIPGFDACMLPVGDGGMPDSGMKKDGGN